MKKTLLVTLLIVTAVMFSTSVFATQLPWLDFGNSLIWNANTNTLTNASTTQVTGVTYRNGVSATPTNPFPPSDPVLGVFTYPPAAFTNVPVTFSISFDGISNDAISVGSWMTADLYVVGPVINPLASTPNPYVVKMSNILVNSGNGSPWADEFDTTLDYSLLYPAELRFAWSGASSPMGGGQYTLNAPGKINPVPEPGTLMLLGSGLAGVGFYTRRRRK